MAILPKNLCFTKKKILLLHILFSLTLTIEANPNNLKETHMSLFFQDFAGGPNATVTPVAGIPGKKWGFLEFGTVYVTDDPITVGMKRDSPEIARGQGIYVTSSLDGGSSHVSVSIAFTAKDDVRHGSTLELQGRSLQLENVREVSVVSGTGKFRFARGYATFETVYYEHSTLYSVIRCNITIMHY